MPGQRCCVCNITQVKDTSATFHRFRRDPAMRAVWLSVFGMQESDLKPSSRVCSRHFPEGDVKKTPSMTLGKYISLYPGLVFRTMHTLM